MKYDVHLHAVVRVKIANVCAPNEKAATQKAQRLVNLHDLFDHRAVPFPHLEQTEFDDTVTHLLVERAGNGNQKEPGVSKCFERFGKGGVTEVPFEKISTHVAVVVEDGNVESVITNRPCQVVVLDHGHAQQHGYDIDEEIQFHDSEVDPWLRCEGEFKARYGKERST
jgi:hypothetical protein